MSRPAEAESSRPGILAYQTALSVLLILAGVFVNKVNLSVLKPVRDSMANALTENYGLSAVSLAVEQFLQSAGVDTEGMPIFDWLKKADKSNDTEKDDTNGGSSISDAASTETDPPAAGDAASASSGAATDIPQDNDAAQTTSGTPQSAADGENESDDADTGHKYSIASADQEADTKAVKLSYTESEPAVPANVVTSLVSLDVTLSAPIKGTITSVFGYRTHPTLKKVYFHYGTDIAAEKGTPILACAAGTVEETGTNPYYGKYIVIRHNSKVSTFYAHCSKISVKKGTKVKAGKKIGEVGSTGVATGAHLHFAIRYDGKYVNPQRYVASL